MAIEQFDKIYPEYHLVMYAKRSQNILIPLLAADVERRILSGTSDTVIEDVAA